jgi:hypothetical protein
MSLDPRDPRVRNPPPTGPPPSPPPTPAVKPVPLQNPWEPTINSSSTQDEKNAAAQYTSVYGGSPTGATPSGPTLLDSYGVPDLGMAYQQSPDLVPNAPGGGGTTSPSELAGAVAYVLQYSPNFGIDLAALLSAEQAVLDKTSATVTEYENLKSLVTNAASSSSIFGQNVGFKDTWENTGTGRGGRGPTAGHYLTRTVYENLDKEGIAFANAINPQMEYLLQQIGGVLEMMGTYAAMLNNAGQLYAYTDSKSALT